MLNLQVTVLWLCCELQEQGWCSGEINCSQSPIFLRDHQDRALCVTSCHLAWVSKLLRGQGRSLATHQCGLGSNPGIDAMWVEFVAGSLSCFERFFSGFSCFHLSLKTNTFKFQFDLECMDTFQQVEINKLHFLRFDDLSHTLMSWQYWFLTLSQKVTLLQTFGAAIACVQVRYMDIVNSIQRKHLMISFDYLVVKVWIA